MAGIPIAVGLDVTDIPGIPGRLVGPVAPFKAITLTVKAMGRPVLTAGAIVGPHGNPYNPKAPGYNPPCAASTIVARTIPNIRVEGKPIAITGQKTGSIAKCGHIVLGPGAPTVLAGFGK